MYDLQLSLMTKRSVITLCVLLLLLCSSCVTMKNYRTIKSSMMAGEIEIRNYQLLVDSLADQLTTLHKQLADTQLTITQKEDSLAVLGAKIVRIEDEYALLMDELKKQNEKQKKSPSKTKR